jgi:hypothetical protein
MSTLGRAFVLVLSLFVASVGISHAHSLPGSVLTFSQLGKQLDLSIEFSLEDLIIAAPELKSLEVAPLDEDLTSSDLKKLTDYIQKHLELKHQSKVLAMVIAGVSLSVTKNDHVGSFILVTIRVSFSVPQGTEVFPLALTYDAVMHEVRTHRVSVYWTEANAELVGLVDFGYSRVEGKPQVHILSHLK